MPGLPPDVAADLAHWLEHVVIAERFCPFAARPYRDDEVYLEALPPARDRALAVVYARAAQMDQHPSPETTLLVDAAGALGDFPTFVAFQTLAEELLERHSPGAYVTAGFHPDYRFADLEPDEATHELHRSPYPVVQLLRRESVAFAKTHYDVPALLERNRRRARELGPDFFRDRRRR